ncbi:MAG: Long-chain-fatty-acid--CoA ligase [Deltaproteobacteria bacterium ADurb.BinA179]|nr:MAG: Long-chain-fatty-acid--CoA ligase [Deltaproteobacteria bacterium ADurb.BinA179]HOD70127.1 long-chain fatty acid--CoA ligase [Deltaproteobacteria bacterium]HOO40668.1 long-chain fatty acid--CoA ligase [Syntrophales bacterium]HOE72347.1 long-chain fatty acid--CoA ligase [Deltaproteobacteria bacterium]HQM19790.1 long-chain fatty acid--CoA ligase [Deltaproteobacteria bacterium]
MEKCFWQKNYDYNVPVSIRYPKFPIQNMVHLAAAQFPQKAAVDFYGSELSFKQVRDSVLRLANAFIRSGVKKGDRVGIALPNCPQYVIAYYAALSAGAVVVNMNPLYTHDELKFMMENTGLETLVTFDGALATMRPLALELGIKQVIVTKLTDYIKAFDVSTARDLELERGWSHFSELLAGSTDTKVPSVAFSPDDPALIQFTGGTTGMPKGALLSHSNVVAATFQCLQWGNSTIPYNPYEKRTVLGIIPYFHVYGNICCMNWSFLSMATQIQLPRFDMDELLGAFARFEQITFFPTVPTMIKAIIDDPRASEMNLPEKIRYLNSGGAPMSVELIQRVKDMGIFFSEGWGMSETTSIGISNPALAHKIGSIGVPVSDNDVRLVDLDEGLNDVEPGEPGEIVIKGPTVMKGYWNNPEETSVQLRDGWLRTGDIGQMDEDGYITIVDRKKDMIIAGGFNIYPREVDEVLCRHPKVAEAVTVGVPDPYRGETVKAFIVLKTGQKATEAEIIKYCKGKLAPYKVPKVVEFRDSIPKSAVGKILRKILREEEIAKNRGHSEA